MNTMRQTVAGFTLVELSIVLVIIGLIVGGVLAGQDMVSQAALRAQISQIEKYNTAVNTFRTKFGYLPGDVTSAQAAQLGLVARGGLRGEGDGNGIIEGFAYGPNTFYGWNQSGEPLFFWEDLSTAGLIDANLSTATDANIAAILSTTVGAYLPPAKIGNGNYLCVYSTGSSAGAQVTGINYFSLSAPVTIFSGNMTSSPGLTVAQAYNIDKKVDDGIPSSGNVKANYVSGTQPPLNAPNSPSDSATTCFNTNNHTYSMVTAPNAVNCALSFRFQ